MIKGEKIRYDIHNILYSIYKFNERLNSPAIKKIINGNKKNDISFINNVTLNSMRFHFHTSKIIDIFIKKKLRDHERILLISAVTQIVFLDFKVYAVINCSVEIAKKLKIYHGLINATLKKIAVEKENLKSIKIEFKDFPLWFKNRTRNLTNKEKQVFLNNFNKEPSLHLVFKNANKLINFEKKLINTSSKSGFLEKKEDIKKIKSFVEGDWWVQDFSSFFPLENLYMHVLNREILDACAAPGGKSFQLLSKNLKLTLNDKSSYRIKILKSNLNRLKFDAEILNYDFIEFSENKKYDFIIIDAPCSSVGTIRKNPEIFFKNEGPDFKKLDIIQQKLLNKASLLLKSNGSILYMVCSFLKNETEDQITKFLSNHKSFQISKFRTKSNSAEYLKLANKGFMITLPDKINGYNIDGYFAVYLKKSV